MILQLTPVTAKALIGKTRIRLAYYSGELPTTPIEVHSGEIFVTGVHLTAGTSDAVISIREKDSTNYFLKNYKLLKEKLDYTFSASIGDLNSFKFYSGIVVECDKTDVWVQIRGFVRIPGAPINLGLPPSPPY